MSKSGKSRNYNINNQKEVSSGVQDLGMARNGGTGACYCSIKSWYCYLIFETIYIYEMIKISTIKKPHLKEKKKQGRMDKAVKIFSFSFFPFILNNMLRSFYHTG